MDAQRIRRLASSDPEIPESWVARSSNIFRQVYLNPAFAWHISGSFARAGVTFPETVNGRDHWLFRAYMWHLDSSTYHNPHVEEAYRLSQNTSSEMLKAMLIAGLGDPVSAHLDIVAEKFGTSRNTIEAFEVLFFNVLDRHQDGLYISNIVYPEGRAVEFEEDYFSSASIDDLILRVGYNHRDVALVARLAGMEVASCVKELIALRDREAELENQIIGNALAMTQSGLLNQRSVGLQRATALLAVRPPPRNKAKESDDHKAYDFSEELAAALVAMPPITDADRQDLQDASRPGRSYWSDETGKVTSFDDATGTAGPTEHTEIFPEGRPAMWRNKDADMPVVIVGIMRSPGFPDHFMAESGTGLPVSEVCFEN